MEAVSLFLHLSSGLFDGDVVSHISMLVELLEQGLALVNTPIDCYLTYLTWSINCPLRGSEHLELDLNVGRRSHSV